MAAAAAAAAPTATPQRIPPPAFLPLSVDRAFYDRIAATADAAGARTLRERLTVPIRSGRAWKVPAGSVCRLLTPEGPQVGDLNIWNANNPRERFWAARTRQLQRAHVTTYDRLWSVLPYLRPLCTITADSLAGYADDVGARVHDLLGTRCDPYVDRLFSGADFDFHCHSNLTRAVLPHGLAEADVHDVLNVFQATGLNARDQYYMEPCPARPGDYFEFFAEVDLLCALSACPGGDLSAWAWGEGAEGAEVDMLACCRPLAVEVWDLAERDELLRGWSSPEPPPYRNMHGLKVPVWGQE